MNHKAVDTSVENLIKIEVPADWATAVAQVTPEISYGSGVQTPHLPTEATSGIAMPQPSRDVNARVST